MGEMRMLKSVKEYKNQRGNCALALKVSASRVADNISDCQWIMGKFVFHYQQKTE